ncbi:succinylglutamate desuccinylase/aspartoacylase family protein [Candidatus Bipolaricaulota bacterium]
MTRRAWCISLGLLLTLFAVVMNGAGQPVSHDIRPGYGVSELRWLSDYHPALEGTSGDTPVYILRGDQPGGTLLLLGGTHGNEIAGTMAATLLIERAEAHMGTVIVIPHTNNSAAKLNTEYLVDVDGELRSVYPFHESWISVTSDTGEERDFRYGSRFTQPEDQGADDPEVYVHPSGFESMGADARNLDRAHPGVSEGTLTEQISCALFQLATAEEVDVVIDMHESSPTSPLAHTIICHPRGIDIASFALFELEADRIYMKLELSRPEHAGISHWEFGQKLNAFSFLIETPNPGQDWSFAFPDLAVNYGSAVDDEDAESSVVDVVTDVQNPLSNRVYEQLAVIQALLANHALLEAPGSRIQLEFPFDLKQLVDSNLGSFLR